MPSDAGGPVGVARIRSAVRHRWRRLLARRPLPPTTELCPLPDHPDPIGEFALFAIVVAFAEADIIEATVANALAQGCDEVFVIDNCSPDDTAARAEAAGAHLLPPLEMTVHDEAVRVRAINDAIARVTASRGHATTWWLVIDADEFPRGPGEQTVRDLLGSLDRRFRTVGSIHLNHYPTTRPAYVRGTHPVRWQPMAERELVGHCALGHHKHPLIRLDAGTPPIEVGNGAHQPAPGGAKVVEPTVAIVTHHVRFRDEADTRHRMALMQGRLAKERPLTERIRVVDAVYEGRWADVRLRKTRLGNRPVRLRPWAELVPGADPGLEPIDPAAAGSGADRPFVAASVLLEWDNPRRSNAHRLPEMLRRLHGELASRPVDAAPVELLIGHNHDVDPAGIEQALADADIRALETVQVRIVDGGTRHYYELKNLLAARSTGEVLAFLDSDVWVEPGWLATVLSEATRRPGAVLAGQSYVGPLDTHFARVTAAGWFFPPEAPPTPPLETHQFWANNVVFPRAVFRSHHFPQQPDRFRGQCSQLGRELRDAGIPLVRVSAARVQHPSFDGWTDLVQRAALNGADFNRSWRLAGRGPYGRRLARFLYRQAGSSALKAVRHRRAYGNGVIDTGLAVAVAVAYWAIAGTSSVIDRFKPGYALRWL